MKDLNDVSTLTPGTLLMMPGFDDGAGPKPHAIVRVVRYDRDENCIQVEESKQDYRWEGLWYMINEGNGMFGRRAAVNEMVENTILIR